MQILTMPPGAKAKAHKHEAHETAIYVLSGEAGTYYGERLENHIVSRAGDFVYIPANVPRLPDNISATEPCVAVVARTDADEQESVVLLPLSEAIQASPAAFAGPRLKNRSRRRRRRGARCLTRRRRRPSCRRAARSDGRRVHKA